MPGPNVCFTSLAGLVGAHRQDLDGVVSVAVTSSRYHKPSFDRTKLKGEINVTVHRLQQR